MPKPIETLAGADATAFQAAIAPHVEAVAQPFADNAADSAADAATSAGTATTKAGEASASAATAGTKAGEALAHAGDAADSAADAGAAAATATTKAGDASASAADAAASETAAQGHASDAAGSAGTATTKANDAAISAAAIPAVDTDPEMAANSDAKIPTQKAAKGYVDALKSKLASTAANMGATMIGFIGTGAAAVARTVLEKLRDIRSVKDFGATGDGATDDAAAIRAAIAACAGDCLYFPKPSVAYLIKSSLGTIPANTTLIGPGRYIECIRRGFNGGYLATLDDGVQVENMWWAGNSASYAGGIIDVLVNMGNQTANNCRFVDATGGTPLHFQSTGAGTSGSRSHWSNLDAWRVDGESGSGNYAVVHGTTGAASGGHPINFVNLSTAGYASIDCGNCNDLTVTGGALFDINHRPESLGAHFTNLRIAPSVGPINLYGGGTFSNCGFGQQVVLKAGCFVILGDDCYYNNGWLDETGAGGSASGITDPTAQLYTPVIYAGATVVPLGTGSVSAQWTRVSGRVFYDVHLTVGSNFTAYAGGPIAVSLPVAQGRITSQCGNAGFIANTAGSYAQIGGVIAASDRVSLNFDRGLMDSASPIPIDEGTIIHISGSYVR